MVPLIQSLPDMAAQPQLGSPTAGLPPWHWALSALVIVIEPVKFLSWLDLRPAASAGGVWHSRLALAATACLLHVLCSRVLRQVLAGEAHLAQEPRGSWLPIPYQAPGLALLLCIEKRKWDSNSLPGKVRKYF